MRKEVVTRKETLTLIHPERIDYSEGKVIPNGAYIVVATGHVHPNSKVTGPGMAFASAALRGRHPDTPVDVVNLGLDGEPISVVQHFQRGGTIRRLLQRPRGILKRKPSPRPEKVTLYVMTIPTARDEGPDRITDIRTSEEALIVARRRLQEVKKSGTPLPDGKEPFAFVSLIYGTDKERGGLYTKPCAVVEIDGRIGRDVGLGIERDPAAVRAWIREGRIRTLGSYEHRGDPKKQKKLAENEFISDSLVAAQPVTLAVNKALRQEGEERPRSKLFISHAAKDFDNDGPVKDIFDTLNTCEGIDPWIAQNQLRAGHTFPDEIADAIAACDSFVLILSEEVLNKGDDQNENWVLKEWLLANDREPPPSLFVIDRDGCMKKDESQLPEWVRKIKRQHHIASLAEFEFNPKQRRHDSAEYLGALEYRLSELHVLEGIRNAGLSQAA